MRGRETYLGRRFEVKDDAPQGTIDEKYQSQGLLEFKNEAQKELFVSNEDLKKGKLYELVRGRRDSRPTASNVLYIIEAEEVEV